MKCSRVTLGWISGLVWLGVGISLFVLGVNLLTAHLVTADGSYPLIDLVSPYFGGTEQATVVLIALALYFGFLKGKHVLGKSARQGIARLRTLPNPVSIAKIYSAKYYVLLGAMILMGMSLKYTGIPSDLRGFIDLIVGTALIQGALIYFRLVSTLKEYSAEATRQ